MTILEAEFSGSVGRTTADVDALLDVRASPNATEEASRRLLRAGFEPNPTIEGLAYRFSRGNDIVDVLAPDHLGRRANLHTVPPNTTLEAIGGTQALNRVRDVLVDIGDAVITVPVPSLAGAIIIKSRVSARARRSRAKHLSDLARLMVLVRDPQSLRSELSPAERRQLAGRRELKSVGNAVWHEVDGAEDGVLAFEIVTT
ncbi:MAG: hypothetical protein WD830_12215 [Chloroflexota bacterium]